MKANRYLIGGLLTLLVCSCSTFKVYDLQCEGLNEPLGIDSGTPHFSWKTLCDKTMMQTAYQIEVASSESKLLAGEADLWQSGKVESSVQIMIPYSGTGLSSRQQCWWRVKIWDNGKESQWSSPQRFGVGILDGMRGNYIGAAPGNSSH